MNDLTARVQEQLSLLETVRKEVGGRSAEKEEEEPSRVHR